MLLAASGAGAKEVPRRDGPVSNDPEVIGPEVVENHLKRTPRIYSKEKCGLHYAEVCTAVGALRLAENMGDQDLIKRIVTHYQGLLAPEDGNEMITRKPHVDHSVMGSLPLEIFLATGDERYKTLGLIFADRQWVDPREDGLTAETRWWIDDMYMVGMIQMQAYRATGDAKYVDQAGSQIVAYLEKLQQPNGLFYHGPEHPFSWGRGNGWVAASMAEVLRYMPEEHPLRPQIMESYNT